MTRNGNRDSTYKSEEVIKMAVRVDEEDLQYACLVYRSSLDPLEVELHLHDALQAARWRVPWLRSTASSLLVIQGLIVHTHMQHA